MIEIRLPDGTPLELGDFSLDMVERNPLFETEILPKKQSYSFTVPNTERNRRALGFPDRLEAADTPAPVEVSVLLAGTHWWSGLLRLQEVDERGIGIHVEELAGGLPTDFGDEKLRDLITDTVVLGTQTKTLELDFFGVPDPPGSYPDSEVQVTTWIAGYEFEAHGNIDPFGGIFYPLWVQVLELANTINAHPVVSELVTASLSIPLGGRLKLEGKHPHRAGSWDSSQTRQKSETKLTYNAAGSGTPARLLETYVEPHVTEVLGSITDIADGSWPTYSVTYFPFFNRNQYSNGGNDEFSYRLNGYDEDSQEFLSNWVDLETATTNRFSISAQPYVWHVLTKIFDGYGLNLGGDIYEDSELQTLVFLNTHANDWVEFIWGDDTISPGVFPIEKDVNIYDSIVYLADHLPDLTVRDFLVAFRRLIAMGFFFDGAQQKLEMVSARSVMEGQVVRNLEPYLAELPQLRIDYPEGITYGSDWGDEDGDDPEPGMVEYVTGNGAQEQLSAIGSSRVQSITATQWVPSVFLPGSSPDFGQGILDDMPARFVFYRGVAALTTGDSREYPVAMPTSDLFDVGGNYGLYWAGYSPYGDDPAKSLFQVWWAAWDRMLRSGRSATVGLRIPVNELRTVPDWFRVKWRVGATHVLIEQVSYTVVRGGIVNAEAVIRKV